MPKKIIVLAIILTMMISIVHASSDDLYKINEGRSETSYRMQPLLERYNSLTAQDINWQIEKYTDIKGHFGKDSIARLASLNIIAGDGVSKFNPNDTLLASHYIKMVVMALGFTPERYGANWWDAYVDIALSEKLINAGEIQDYAAPLTRELAAVIGFRALMKYEARPTGDDVWYDYNVSKITDYTLISDQYKNDVVMAYRMGIILGNNNFYNPKGTLTRAEGAVIVNRLIDKDLRVESVPKPEEIIIYTRRTEINKANFDFGLKPGETFMVYPGYFPLNEIYDVFKAMNHYLNLGGGYREILFGGLEGNFSTWMFINKEAADNFFLVDSAMPTHFASFAVYLDNCFKPNGLKDNNTGHLYVINTPYAIIYDKYMKLYVYELLKVLFEDDADEAIRLHDNYLGLSLNNKRAEWKSYMLNNRKVHYSGGNTEISSGGFRMEIWAKGALTKENFGY